MKKYLGYIIYKVEVIVKKGIFDCHSCGQCMLGETGLICPMSCPKGIRNGPCGGTKGGFCEVYPEKNCVWVRIQARRRLLEKVMPVMAFNNVKAATDKLYSPANRQLFHTSSLVNYIFGRDSKTRKPMILPQPKPESGSSALIKNQLQQILQNKKPVITSEIRTPKTLQGLQQVKQEIALIAPLVDALNVTSNHGGVKRIDPLMVAREIAQHPCKVIMQICGRDIDSESFDRKIHLYYFAGFHNLLCLTGDWPANNSNLQTHDISESFAMDASQMIHMAKTFKKRQLHRLLIGGAINPQSMPSETVINRLQQKVRCGAEFIQTQVICDAESYLAWLALIKKRLPHHPPILAGIPYIGTKGGLNALNTLPGVKLPETLYAEIAQAEDTAHAGCKFARRLIHKLLASGLVDGFHLMNFGINANQMAVEIEYLQAITGQTRSPTLIVSNTGRNSMRKPIENTPAKTLLRGSSSEISISPNSHTYTIGERCNVLGYQSVKQAVEEQNYPFIVQRAIEQEKAGADIINISMVGSNVPEIEVLPEVVRLITKAINIPISIDYGSVDALEAALEHAPPRSLINSVSGETVKCEPILALAKKYHAAMIAMPCTDKGIPATAQERLDVAIELIHKASGFGITKDDLIFDAICLAVATDQNAGITTFETCQLLRNELGVNITLGASNVSFGLPNRSMLNSTYLSMAIASGMNVALTDITIPSIKWAMRSADCCLGQDQFASRYIQEFRRESAGACA